MSLNSVSVSGNVVRDADLRSTPSNFTIVEFSIAVNERRKNRDGEWGDYANYFDCKLMGKRGDALYPFIKKGVKVAISGKLHQDRWQDKSGSNRSKVTITVDEIELMSRRDGRQQSRQEQPHADYYEDDQIPF